MDIVFVMIDWGGNVVIVDLDKAGGSSFAGR
jgi:hypothetical protein